MELASREIGVRRPERSLGTEEVAKGVATVLLHVVLEFLKIDEVPSDLDIFCLTDPEGMCIDAGWKVGLQRAAGR